MKPTSNMQYEWVFAGDAAHSAATSQIETVDVIQSIAAHVVKAKPASAPREIYGTVTPAVPGATVVLQELVHRRWMPLGAQASVKKQMLPGRKARSVGFALRFSLPKSGKYKLRVVEAASSRYGGGTSAVLTLNRS